MFDISEKTNGVSNDIDKQSTENSPVIKYRLEQTEESLAVSESNGSDVLLARSYSIFIVYVLRQFISCLAAY